MNGSEQGSICGFDGNPDLFGLGVRVGIYMQIVSFILAGGFLPKESAYLQGSAFVFLLAIFIALVRESVARTLHATEVALVGWLIVYQVIGVSSTLTRNLTVTGALRMVLAFLIFPAYISYSVWFWYVGIDSFPQGPCDEYGFFWSKVNVRGWYRTVSKVGWTFALVIVIIIGLVGAAMLGLSAAIAISNIRNARRRLRMGQQTEDHAGRHRQAQRPQPDKKPSLFTEFAEEYPRLYRTLKFVGLLFIAALALAFTVTPMELLIHWNEVRGLDRLDSVGQLVPFMLAAGQLIHVVYRIFLGSEEDAHQAINAHKKDNDESCPKRQRVTDVEEHEMGQVADDSTATSAQLSSVEQTDTTSHAQTSIENRIVP